MEPTSRRNFFKQAGGAAAIAGAVAVAPISIAGAATNSLDSRRTGIAEPELTESERLGEGEHLIAHVKNAETGEISLFVGSREVLIQDPSIAARLVRATL